MPTPGNIADIANDADTGQAADLADVKFDAGAAEIARNADMQVIAVEADIDEDVDEDVDDTPKGQKWP